MSDESKAAKRERLVALLDSSRKIMAIDGAELDRMELKWKYPEAILYEFEKEMTDKRRYVAQLQKLIEWAEAEIEALPAPAENVPEAVALPAAIEPATGAGASPAAEKAVKRRRNLSEEERERRRRRMKEYHRARREQQGGAHAYH